ncbi:deoxycytidylate deaminase [Kitasatospora purpeofusca]|uniref:deoxycytidylate deaminase n=1 Tax=Kitasatospora purpeofusca TaxID=67352 RepID=UPI0036EF28E0
MSGRPNWELYFHTIAAAVALRGDCIRSQVGAVLVSPDNRIVSTGYNGSPPGGPSCHRGECPRCLSDAPSGSSYDGCVEIHAEANALLYANRADCIGATLYVTREPCDACSKMIRAAGIKTVRWPFQPAGRLTCNAGVTKVEDNESAPLTEEEERALSHREAYELARGTPARRYRTSGIR